MRVLVACEESQTVCAAFRERGHEAYSCDIQPCSGGHPEWLIQADARELLKLRWDLLIAHPPCTDLAVSGAAYFKEKQKNGRQQKAVEFFMRFVNADCGKIAVENPVCIMSTRYRKPDQIIQPYMFGHPEKKKTCLWLKGLPLLFATDIVVPRGSWVGSKSRNVSNYEWAGKRSAKDRSKTFPGIARAMAEQWGGDHHDQR